MADASELVDLLDRLGSKVNGADPNLAVKAFGLLLLGKVFEKPSAEGVVDPTEAILSGAGNLVRRPDL